MSSRQVIRSRTRGLEGVRTEKAAHASLAEDPEAPGERVIAIDFLAAQGPAERDTWCQVDVHDWSRGAALGLRVFSRDPLHLSVSFFDRHRVAYTAWADVRGGAWEDVRVAFDTIRPNPYFQRPDAELGSPIDLADIPAIAFAPQVPGSGRLLLGDIVLLDK